MKLVFTKTLVSKESRMDVHKNARLTPHCRGLVVERVLRGRPQAQVAIEFGISVATVRKWLRRFEAEGAAGLQDRSSRPRRSPRATVRELELAVLALRRQRLTLVAIAGQLGLSRATVIVEPTRERVLWVGRGRGRRGTLDREPARCSTGRGTDRTRRRAGAPAAAQPERSA